MTHRAHYSLLVVALSGVLAACAQPVQGAVATPIPVKVQAVERSATGVTSRYSGSLEPDIRVESAFRVSGYVDQLGLAADGGSRRPLDKGDFVKKGSLLARVHPADYAERVASTQAQLSEARAQAQLTRADLERAKKLFEVGASTQAQLDSSIAKADAANAQVESAVSRLAEANLSLGDTLLRAPQDGVVLARNIEIGSLVAPGQPAFTLADTRSMKAVFGAPHALVERLELGSPLRVFVGAEGEASAPDKLLAARVTRIAPSADTNGRLFTVEAALPNPAGTLRPGAVVSVHVPQATLGGGSLVVPLAAVLRSPNAARAFAVFVLEGDTERAVARLHDVDLGEVVGNSVTVRSGLEQRQRVVTLGGSLLRDGSEVVVIR